MPQFGDELILENFKIPWLIWIQLLVMVLLVILLFFGFSVFTSYDSISSSVSSSSAPPSSGRVVAATSGGDDPSSSNGKSKVNGTSSGRDPGTSGGMISEDPSGEECSLKDSTISRIFRHAGHPCNYLGLAKQALFKCFGFDPSSGDQHEKQD